MINACLAGFFVCWQICSLFMPARV